MDETNIQKKLNAIKAIHRYLIVNDIHSFSGVTYKFGTNSSDTFASYGVESALKIFMDSKKWTIVKYPCVTRSENETLCSVGITNHVYLGCIDESNIDFDMIDSDDDYNTFSTTPNVQDIQEQIDAEINSRRKEKPIDPYQLLAPYLKEIISLQKGRSN